jgi:hypothetical protein
MAPAEMLGAVVAAIRAAYVGKWVSSANPGSSGCAEMKQVCRGYRLESWNQTEAGLYPRCRYMYKTESMGR